MQRRINGTYRSNRAFTLTEVLVAASILLAVMVPILKALTLTHVGSKKIEWKTHSLIHAQSKLDEIRAQAAADYDQSFTQAGVSMGNSYYCKISDTGYGSDIRTITVQCGFDVNGNNTLNADEVHVNLKSKIARLD